MGNDAAVEAQTKKAQPRPAFIYRVIFLAPIIVAAFGIAGYLKWTVAGLPFEYTSPWLALSTTSVCWGFTHWVCLLRRDRD